MEGKAGFWSELWRTLRRKAAIRTIDITKYDKKTPTCVRYTFTKDEFAQPRSTLKRLSGNPREFIGKRGENKVVLTPVQNERLMGYLKDADYYMHSFGSVGDATHLLAFSFGEGREVNEQLAALVIRALASNSSLDVSTQWEIADILEEHDIEVGACVQRIELGLDKDYIRTDEIVKKFVGMSRANQGDGDGIKLAVVAQAWHAPRCIRLCGEEDLEVVAGRFVDSFPENDPQEWTRDAFSWVLKEATKTD